MAKVGLKINAGKIKLMSYNQESIIIISKNDCTNLVKVHVFKYLGAWIVSTALDIK